MLEGFRFFTSDWCTCRAFRGPRHCFHSLAVGLAQGRQTAPFALDETPIGPELSPSKRAKAGAKAAPRYAPARPHVMLRVHHRVGKGVNQTFDLLAEVDLPVGSTEGAAVRLGIYFHPRGTG